MCLFIRHCMTFIQNAEPLKIATKIFRSIKQKFPRINYCENQLVHAVFKILCWFVQFGKVIVVPPVIALFGSVVIFIHVGGFIMYCFSNAVDYGIWCHQFGTYNKYIPKIFEFMCVYLVMGYCKQLYNEWKEHSRSLYENRITRKTFFVKVIIFFVCLICCISYMCYDFYSQKMIYGIEDFMSCNLQYQCKFNDVQTCIDKKFSQKSSEAPCKMGFYIGDEIVWVPKVCQAPDVRETGTLSGSFC